MKTPEKPKRLCACCDHYEVCQVHSHAGALHELNADRCGLYSDRTHDRNRIAVLEQVVEEGNMQIEQLEGANAELLTKVEQLTSKCHQLERERDAVDAMPRWISVEERLPEVERRVLLLTEHKGVISGEIYHIVTCGFYEDGKITTENSKLHWDTFDLGFEYSEDLDAYLVPEGWVEECLEERDGCVGMVLGYKVTHWMPMPEPPKEADHA